MQHDNIRSPAIKFSFLLLLIYHYTTGIVIDHYLYYTNINNNVN